MYDKKPDWSPAIYNNKEYYGYPNRPAEFYLDNHLIPVTPHVFKINNNSTNESDQLVDGTPITIPKLDKAQSFEIEFIFLHDQRFQRNAYSTFTKQPSELNESGMAITWYEVKDLTDYLWQKKQDREPVVLTIIYPNQENLNLKALLDDYSYTQDATNASDYEFSLTFTEYHPALNQEIDVELQNTLIKHDIRSLRLNNPEVHPEPSVDTLSAYDRSRLTGEHVDPSLDTLSEEDRKRFTGGA